MIFFQPIILAAEFVQHVIVIVLCGLMVVECASCLPMTKWRGMLDALRTSSKERETIILLGVTLLAALWFILEYFIDLSEVRYHALIHVPTVSAILVLLWRVMRKEIRVRKLLFGIFVIAGAHIGLDVLLFLFGLHLPFDMIVRTVLKTTEVLILYFLILRYLIVRDKP